MTAPLRLILVDIDGCLTPGVTRAFDWDALRVARSLNWRARAGEPVPAVTVCTGRPQPFAEATMQAIDAHVPGIFEHGCGLYVPSQWRSVYHPRITAGVRQTVEATRRAIQRHIVERGLGFSQPGKELALSVFPEEGVSRERLLEEVRAVMAGVDASLKVQTSAAGIDVSPAGIDKAEGVRWLAEELGIPPGAMGGIGDSQGDVGFLQATGRSGCPANAAPVVHESVDYVSPYADGAGVVDILERWVRGERAV
jgi:hydroxymethylpyrimidine pyrophosphatase-like HAD family hydrolase